MHGIDATNKSMRDVVSWIQEALPGTYVKNVQIGDTNAASILRNLNSMVADFCKQIEEDPNLQESFNLIGYSQGGLITRGYIERCGSGKVYNYVGENFRSAPPPQSPTPALIKYKKQKQKKKPSRDSRFNGALRMQARLEFR